jgi:hypothetical protein
LLPTNPRECRPFRGRSRRWKKTRDKIVLVQKDTEAKNLAAKQSIAVIYASNAGDHVLLAAVVQAD